ncbi:MAG TPA: serine hydrolase [Herpetosiphonaceae bacterium]
MLSFSALASARISLRMLLSHSAGLADHEELFGARGPAGLAQYVRERITPDLLVAEPGKVFSYSSPGLDLAGYIAEVVSGTPYPELMRQLVFEPLEMSRTLFDPLVAMTYPVALGHDLLEDGSVRVQHRFAENSGQYPSSFALSTALDLANFGALHLGGGSFRGTRILSGDLVAEMQRRQVETYTPWGDGYGLAFVTETHKGVRRVKQGGMIGSFGSLFVLAPERQIGFVALYNLTEQLSLNALEAYLFDALLGLPAEFPLPAPIEPDRELWQRYTGAYTRDGRVVRVAIGDDGLTIQGSRHPLPLIAFGESRYHNQEYGINVGFVPEAAGPVNYMMVNGEIYARAASDEAQSTEDRSDG